MTAVVHLHDHAPARSGLWVATTCRHCGHPLREVNPGHTDGARAIWVGACTNCHRQWVVTTSVAPVPARGPGDRRP